MTPDAKTSVQTIHFLGNLLTPRARSAETNGSFSIMECYTAPGAGAPPHTQADEEGFLVMEGRFEFIVDGHVKQCGPGEFAYVKPGAIHAFRNIAETPSKMLIFNTPGGQHEGFFLAVGDVVAPGQQEFPVITAPDVAALMAAARRFGIEILLPPA